MATIDLPQAPHDVTYAGKGPTELDPFTSDKCAEALFFVVQEAAALLGADLDQALFRVARDVNAHARHASSKGEKDKEDEEDGENPMGADVEWVSMLLKWADANSASMSGPDDALADLSQHMKANGVTEVDERFLVSAAARYDQLGQSFRYAHGRVGRVTNAPPPLPSLSASKAIRRLLEKRRAAANARVEKRIIECDADDQVAVDEELDDMLPLIADAMTGDMFVERAAKLPTPLMRAYMDTLTAKPAEVARDAWRDIQPWAPRVFGPSALTVWYLCTQAIGGAGGSPSPFAPLTSRCAFACPALPEFHPLQVAWSSAEDDGDDRGSSVLLNVAGAGESD